MKGVEVVEDKTARNNWNRGRGVCSDCIKH